MIPAKFSRIGGLLQLAENSHSRPSSVGRTTSAETGFSAVTLAGLERLEAERLSARLLLLGFR